MVTALTGFDSTVPTLELVISTKFEKLAFSTI